MQISILGKLLIKYNFFNLLTYKSVGITGAFWKEPNLWLLFSIIGYLLLAKFFFFFREEEILCFWVQFLATNWFLMAYGPCLDANSYGKICSLNKTWE